MPCSLNVPNNLPPPICAATPAPCSGMNNGINNGMCMGMGMSTGMNPNAPCSGLNSMGQLTDLTNVNQGFLSCGMDLAPFPNPTPCTASAPCTPSTPQPPQPPLHPTADNH